MPKPLAKTSTHEQEKTRSIRKQ